LYNIGNDRRSVSSALTRRFDLSSLGDFSDFPYAWYMKGEYRQHFGFENWEAILRDIRNLMARDGWFKDSKYSNYLKKINEFLRYTQDPKLIDRIRSHVPPPEALFEATKNYGVLIGRWSDLVGTLRQKKQEDGKVWTAKSKGTSGRQEGIEESIRKLIEEINGFTDFTEEAFVQLDEIEVNLSDMKDPDIRNRLIKEHDDILDYIDKLIEIFEMKIDSIIAKI